MKISYLEKWHRSSQSRNVATFNMTTSNWLNEYSSTENTWGIVVDDVDDDDDDAFVDVVTSSFTLFVIFLVLCWWGWCGVAVFTGFDDCDGGCGGIDAENDENDDDDVGDVGDVGGEWDERGGGGDDDRKLFLDVSERLTLLANRSNSMCANELTCKWWWWWSWLLSMSLVELSVELSSFSCESKIVFLSLLLLLLLGDIVVVVVVVGDCCCGWSLRRWLISSSETPALVLLADPIFFCCHLLTCFSFRCFCCFSLVFVGFVFCCLVFVLYVWPLELLLLCELADNNGHKVKCSRCVVWDGMDRQLSLFSFRRKGSRAFGDSLLPNHACTHPVGIIVIHHFSLDHCWIVRESETETKLSGT